MFLSRIQQKLNLMFLPKVVILLVIIAFLGITFYRGLFLGKSNDAKFYANAALYWGKQESNEDAMVGEIPGMNLSAADIADSKLLLDRLKSKYFMGTERALDCPSGIGRVTKHVLLPLFSTVDMLDVTEKFIQASADHIGKELSQKIGKKYISGLQDFSPEPSLYDLIWIQWGSTFLVEDDLIATLIRMKNGLKPNGFIVVKDNVARHKTKTRLFKLDSTFVRPKSLLMDLFSKAGLKVYEWRKQQNWPKHYYEVHMFAMK